MDAPPRMLFPNLPVADLEASKAFFGALGFTFNEKFSDDQAAAMHINDQAWVMLLQRERFEGFVTKPLPDPATTTGLTLCVSAENRKQVDALAEAAEAAGASPAKDPSDYGFMYGRSFLDPDGHHWEVMWMDPRAVEQGPEAFAASQAG